METRCNMGVWSSLPLNNSGENPKCLTPQLGHLGLLGSFLPTSQPATDTCSNAALQLYHTSNPSRNVVTMALALSKVILFSIPLKKQHAKLNSGVKRHAVAFLSVLSFIIRYYCTFLRKKNLNRLLCLLSAPLCSYPTNKLCKLVSSSTSTLLPKSQVSATAALHRRESPHSFQRVAFFHLDGGWRTIRRRQCWETAGRSGWGWGRAAPDAAGISISACCCYHGYSDMQANRRCQTNNSEDQLETLGEGR